MTDEFSIGTLAERTGLSPTVLRAWEQRHSFPQGRRLESGHRRFTEADVDLVREVLAARESGLTLQQAIDGVVERHRHDEDDSVHAALLSTFADLRPIRLDRRVLIAASTAIEDDSLARADRPLALGAFQVGHHFARSEHRWDELARTSTWCAVVADFEHEAADSRRNRGPDPSATPARCQLPSGSALRREWTVVTLSEQHSAVLSAWEIPVPAGKPRIFESVITTRRAPAVAAARVLVAAARAAGAVPPSDVDRLLDPSVQPLEAATSHSDRLWVRTLTQLSR